MALVFVYCQMNGFVIIKIVIMKWIESPAWLDEKISFLVINSFKCSGFFTEDPGGTKKNRN